MTMVVAGQYKTFKPRRHAPVVQHICPYCMGWFVGVKQKKYCSKSCTEAAYRARKSALIDALTLEFGCYGLKRAQVETCANLFLERCQYVALALGLYYVERERLWIARHSARVQGMSFQGMNG